MTAYYNEIDPAAAAWLRALIEAGHIAPGIVDERSIEDVRPDELMGHTQCHFFAGVGVWSYALRQAGWPDDRPVWTGSCPCQPFSAAGKGDGFDDERHLWPAFHHLIAQCNPSEIFGEQVASKAVDPWIDLVHADLEALGYAFGSVPFPSAGVGAPHIRDRNYWVADATSQRRNRGQNTARPGGWASAEAGGFTVRMADTRHDHDAGEISTACVEQQKAHGPANIACRCGISSCRLDDTVDTRPQGHAGHDSAAGRQGPAGSIATTGLYGGMGNAYGPEHEARCGDNMGAGEPADAPSRPGGAAQRPGPTNGLWADADWLFCRDGKWRPVMPGTFPLVTGAPARVGRLRGYGNAINAKAAQAFIESYLEAKQPTALVNRAQSAIESIAA